MQIPPCASHDPAMPYFIPTAEWIDSLQVGDYVPNCFGSMAQITDINYQANAVVDGRSYIVFNTWLSETSKVSGSFREGRLHRALPIIARHTSHELDAIERRGAEVSHNE